MSLRRWAGRVAEADDGAGGVLAVAIVGATVVATLGVLALSAALATSQRVISAADAAALAAADVVLGVVAGEPCALASEVARAHDAVLTACRIDGAEAHVTTEDVFAGIPISASARAGPAPRRRRPLASPPSVPMCMVCSG